MAFTRLAAATADLTVNIVITKKLKPYFTLWYNATKITGDTPAKFALRMLKEKAQNYYLTENTPAEMAILETEAAEKMQLLADDGELLKSELN